jgi:putative SOS response-associated peptidase YedK
MCNLYRMTKGVDEVARLFGAKLPPTQLNFPEEVYPGYPGVIVQQRDGVRTLEQMTWGFPVRLKSMKPTTKPKAVTNARDDKLATPFWEQSFAQRRCLIPATAWAEPEGAARQMTRTWYARAGCDLFAIGGVWRPTSEWGDAFAMVMVDSCPQMTDVHDRMPVILGPEHWSAWMQSTPEEAFSLVRTCDEELDVSRTVELWNKPGMILSQAPSLI